ncbi:glycerate kinase [Thioclava sp. 'Guangxiensis']|uniref:glycerate kinase type-2 family protein n=1 Tax=Thioclava sp. 'Guangxiensis' TaxID=3149044 RepID=UPI00387839D7
MPEPVALLHRLFNAAVAAADPMICVPEALGPKPDGRVVIVGAGKASARMAEAVESVWGPCEGLVITRYGYGRPTKGIEIVEAAHPVPDQAGVEATRRMLDLLEGLGEDDTVIALISGGGSALLCAPAGEITLAEKQAVNRALLESGATIDRMNVLRKHLSRVKGGQLAAAAYPARMRTLMISDVPGDDPAFIASGPTVGDATTSADARAIADMFKLDLPASVRAVLDGPTGVVAPGDPRLSRATTEIIAAPSVSLEAAAELAQAEGIGVEILGDALEGEARDLAAKQARLAMDLSAKGTKPLLLLSGGECTVTQRGKSATASGGPNAEYMLGLALTLAGAPRIWAMACDTDGVDGSAEVAGAWVGPGTLTLAHRLGVSAPEAMAVHDSHGFFAALGQQVVPGPTLTNVNDFRAILIL